MGVRVKRGERKGEKRSPAYELCTRETITFLLTWTLTGKRKEGEKGGKLAIAKGLLMII